MEAMLRGGGAGAEGGPTLVLGADLDVSFPGQRLLARAGELFLLAS